MPSRFPVRPGSRLVDQLVGHLEVGDAEQWDAVLAGGHDPVALSGHRDGVILHVPGRGFLPAVHAPGRHEEREWEAEEAKEAPAAIRLDDDAAVFAPCELAHRWRLSTERNDPHVSSVSD